MFDFVHLPERGISAHETYYLNKITYFLEEA